MGCTIAKKTFNINLNGTNTSHKLMVHSTSNGNNHVLQFKNNGEAIKWIEATGKTHDKFAVISFGSVVVPLTFTDIEETIKIWYWPGGFFWKPPNRIRLYINDIDSQDGTHISQRTSTEHCCKEFCPSYLTLLGVMGLFIMIGGVLGAWFMIYLSLLPVIILVMLPCCIGNETYDAPNIINTNATPTNQAYQHPIVQLLAGNIIPELSVKPMQQTTSQAQQLPPNWIILYANDGRTYYQNEMTKKTQWEFPQPDHDNVSPMPQTVVVVVDNISQKKVINNTGVVGNGNNDLPDGWNISITPDGKTLYINDITKKTQWEKPVENKNTIANNNHNELPNGWIKLQTADGKTYYQDNTTKETHWELPK